jgi:hypothetical protein
LPSNTNTTNYTYSAGPTGVAPDGTQWSVILTLEAIAGSAFTDDTAWTLHDALMTALTSVGWALTPNDVSLLKQTFDDTTYNGNTTQKTFV